MKMKFKVLGLDCANCAAKLEEEIKKAEGVDSASISFMSQRMEIECDEAKKEEIIKKIKEIINEEEPDVTIEEI